MSVIFIPPASAASVPDATETTSGKIRIATSAEATAGVNDVTAMTPAKVKAVIDSAVAGGVIYRGTFDASSPSDLSSAIQGDLYIIDGAGTYAGRSWAVGDHLLVNANMGGTFDSAKIDKIDSTDAVTSVAGRTGAITLGASDVSGLATVATSGAYADLSGTPTLGTAAAEDVGTSAGNVIQLDGSARLPAVDGSQLTNLPAAPVTSVAGRTGAVTLGASDISGLATVATSGAYADLSGTPTLATVATSGAYADLSGTPTLGTAAAEDVGTSAGNVVQLDSSARLPAVDGSQLTNLPSAPVTSVAGRTGAVTLGASDISGLATVATSGAYADLSGTPTLATVATSGAYADLSGTPTLGTAAAEDVGTSAGNVVQLDGSARLPAVDGSQLTNLPSGGGGTLPSVVIITSSTTLSARSTDELIRLVVINNGSSSVTVTLPSVASGDVGFAVELKLLGTGAVTIGASGGATIDGGASATLDIQYEARTIRAASTSTWYIV